MKIKEHLTIIEQKDIINDISSDTGIEPKAIQDMLYSLRNTIEYYSKSVTIGESKDEKFLIKLFLLDIVPKRRRNKKSGSLSREFLILNFFLIFQFMNYKK